MTEANSDVYDLNVAVKLIALSAPSRFNYAVCRGSIIGSVGEILRSLLVPLMMTR